MLGLQNNKVSLFDWDDINEATEAWLATDRTRSDNKKNQMTENE